MLKLNLRSYPHEGEPAMRPNSDDMIVSLDSRTVLDVARHVYSRDLTATVMGNYLSELAGHPVVGGPRRRIPPPVGMLGWAVHRIRARETNRKHASFSPYALEAISLGAAFIKELLLELRKLLCGGRKNPEPLEIRTQGVLAGLATAIAHSLGTSNATATGLATLLLLSIAGASKKAFCRTMDPDKILRYVDLIIDSPVHDRRSRSRGRSRANKRRSQP